MSMLSILPVAPVAIDSLSDPGLIERWHVEKGMLAFALRRDDLQSTVIDVLVKPSVPYAELERNADRLRAFLLLAYASNPELLARAEPRVRQLFVPLPELVSTAEPPLPSSQELKRR